MQVSNEHRMDTEDVLIRIVGIDDMKITSDISIRSELFS
jgi:transcription elongation GreA/GreB family factor